jgi:hypothetical protein
VRRVLMLLLSFSLALLALLALSYATAEGSSSGTSSSPFANFPWESHHHSWFSTLSDLNLASSDVRPVATVAGLSFLLYSTWGLRLGAVAGQTAAAAGSAGMGAAGGMGTSGGTGASGGTSASGGTGSSGGAEGSGGTGVTGGGAAAPGMAAELPWNQAAALHSVGAAGPPGLSLGESAGSGAGQLVQHLGAEADALRSLGRKLQAIPKYGDLIGFFFIIAPRVSRYIQHHPREWWRMDLFWADTLGDVLHWTVTLLAGLLGALTGRLLTLVVGAGFTDLAIIIGDAVLTLVCDQVFTHVPEVDVRLRLLGQTVVHAAGAKRLSGS